MKAAPTSRLALVLAAAGTAVLPVLPASAALQTVKVGNFYYEDATVGDGRIVVDSGDQIRFVVQDGGPGTPHTVDIDAFGIHSGGIAAGETYTTKPLTTPGTYRLYCKPHQRRGHETTLVVRGNTAGPAPSSTAPQPSTQPSTQPTTATSAPRPTSKTTGPTTEQTQPTGATATSGSVGGTTASLTTSPAPGSTTTSPRSGSSPGTGGSGSDAPVAEGRGTASGDELDAGDLGESDLEKALGRSLTSSQPWTRGVRLALLVLVPMLLLAGWAVSRWEPDER